MFAQDCICGVTAVRSCLSNSKPYGVGILVMLGPAHGRSIDGEELSTKVRRMSFARARNTDP